MVVRPTITVGSSTWIIGLWALAAGCALHAAGAAPSPEQFRRFALLHEGNASHGKALFGDEQRLGCTRCHSVDATASKAGPDLFAIGDKYGRREIIDSILTPSATIAVGYSTTLVETESGEDYAGIIKEATEAGIGLMGADGVLVHLSAAQMRERRTSEVSLMPEGLHASLELQEFADLIEYLVSLKQPENEAVVHHGMPAIIPLRQPPVAIWPFHGPELHFEHPVWFGPVPGMSNQFLVVEHESGRVWALERAPDASADTRGWLKRLVLDTGVYAKGTRGLLGLVFHPDFVHNRRYFVAKHIVQDGRFATLILEFRAGIGVTADSGEPPRLIMKLEALTNVHYGGGLSFGPDGYLYIGMGDTGPQEDPQGHGQDTSRLLGKMLRIDVDHRDGESNYSIPTDNPFVNHSGFRPEIWAYGFREPWRFSFDPANGDLWVGDVGQDRYEEVDVVRRGENYGWNVYEGFEPFSNKYRRPAETFIPPVFAYGRKYGPSVTGGYVYRADPSSSFYGAYIFGDYESRRVFALRHEERVLKSVSQIATAPQRIVSFGRGNAGELYIVGYEGTIYRLELEGVRE